MDKNQVLQLHRCMSMCVMALSMMNRSITYLGMRESRSLGHNYKYLAFPPANREVRPLQTSVAASLITRNCASQI